jgi:hypothetical protein
MYRQIIRNTIYGPQGQTYRVRVTLSSGGTVQAWYWTGREALEARDRLLDLGFRPQVDGLPTIIGCA